MKADIRKMLRTLALKMVPAPTPEPPVQLKENEYQCAMCRGVFEFVRDENWSKEKAMEELTNTFGEHVKPEHCDLVCDDCWQKVRPDKNPEEFAAYKADMN